MNRDPLSVLAELPGVAEAVTEARAAIDQSRGHNALRRRKADVVTEAVLRGARASAALEGADWPLEELRRMSSVSDAGDAEAGAAVVAGALRLTAELATLLPTWRTTPRQALARMHVLAAAGVAEEASIGRPGPESAERMKGLMDLLAARTSAPALVLASVVHGELIASRPFVWGNGLVARAAARLVLADKGLDPDLLCALEIGHAEAGAAAYEEALDAYDSGTPDGVATWLRHCCAAVTVGAKDSLAVSEALLRG